jgi:hypothetical protein
VVIQQLIQTLGLTGTFVTPQEAAAAYQREHQEVSAQIVFFSASNFCRRSWSRPTPSRSFTRTTWRNTACPTACRSATSNSTLRISRAVQSRVGQDEF